MSSNFEKFRRLHEGKKLFVLPNAWDAKSAKGFATAKFTAIGTSSAAVAASLGYADGEGMPFADYLFVIKRILAATNLPVTIDLEMGYGKSNAEIAGNIIKLAELGVAGVNIEDSEIGNGARSLKDAAAFAKTLAHIKEKLLAGKLSIFINVRCDTYILGVKNKQQETLDRIKLYEANGADGIFLPCIKRENDIAQAVGASALPVNVMCIPGLPGFDTLEKLGVRRASMGPFLFNKTYDRVVELSKAITTAGNFSPIL